MNSTHRATFDHVNIDRKFKLGLYKDTGQEKWRAEYYQWLHQSIQNRGQFCPYFKRKNNAQ